MVRDGGGDYHQAAQQGQGSNGSISFHPVTRLSLRCWPRK